MVLEGSTSNKNIFNVGLQVFIDKIYSMIGMKPSLWLMVVDKGDHSTKNHSKLYKVIRSVQET
jgi:hypothetical protein